MKRTFSIEVQGREHTWSFPFEADSRYLQDWLDDGLDVALVANTIPVWAQRLGLTRVWFLVQDAWQWLRVW